MSRAVTSLALALSLSPAVPAQARRYTQDSSSGGPLRVEQAAYDVLAYDLALVVFPGTRRIDGTLRMRARMVPVRDAQGNEVRVERILMQLDPRLEIRAVSATTGTGDEAVSRPVQIERQEGDLWVPVADIRVSEEFTLAFDYGGKPREAVKPPWDGGFTFSARAPKNVQPWITTTCQGEGADLWWPCKDHPSDEPDEFDLAITVPSPLTAACNGRLLGVEPATLETFPESLRTPQLDPRNWHTARWHVSTPINNYGIALNIAPYVTLTTQYQSVTGESFEFTFWHLPEHSAEAKKLFPELQEHMAFFEEVCGPYPFRADKYGVAETPHLGMEHQTIIAYGNGFKGDEKGGFRYDWLHHHELSHEWWGNLVTARDWSDFWIHEGIGTYMQALYLERKFGPEAYRKKLQQDLARVQNKGTVAPREPRTTQQMYFASNLPDAPDIDVYMKGSWICHSLRWVLGDETFFRVLRRWAYPDPALEKTSDGSACRFTSTDELLAIAEQVSGRELDWFFELYLRQPALPTLEATEREGGLDLAWKTPDDLPFPMPVEVEVGGELRRVEMPEGRGRVELGGAAYELDPLQRVLCAR